MAFRMKGWSPFTKGGKGWDKVQTALTGAGMFPGAGNAADLANTAISGARALGSKIKGDKKGVKKHLTNAAINAGSMIPVIGQGISAAGVAKKYATEKDESKKRQITINKNKENRNIT